MAGIKWVTKSVLVVMMALMAACTATREATHYPTSTQLPALPNDSLRTIFHYTEGLKASLLMRE